MSLKTAYVHPTLLLSLSDHIHRFKSLNGNDSNNDNSLLYGLILGRNINDSISLLNAFEISETDLFHIDGLKKNLTLLGELYGKGYLTLVGVYSITLDSDYNTIDTLEQAIDVVNEIKHSGDGYTLLDGIDVDHMLMLKFDGSFIPEKSDSFSPMLDLYRYPTGEVLPFEIRLIEAEKISLDTYKYAPKQTAINDDNGIEYLASGLSDLEEKLKLALDFITKVKKNEINVYDNQEKYDTLKSLSYLAGKIEAVKSTINQSGETDTEDIDKIIALGSLCSSLLRENLNYSI